MDIRDYFTAWRSRWKTILVCVVLAVGAAAAVSVTTQPSYVATTRMFVSTTGGASVAEAYQGNLFAVDRVTSYAALAMGKQVAQRSIDQMGLNRTAEQVMAEVTATAVPSSVLLDISVTDANATLARDLANVVASQTSSLVQQLETSARGGSPAASATIVDLADLPTTPASPQLVRNLLFGLLGGLVIGLIAAVLRAKLDRSVRKDDDLAASTGAPVLGSLPADPKAKSGELLFGPGHPALTNAFREIRTNVLALESDSPVRTLIVTAPRAGTGSTTAAAGLSAALAETGRSVVLLGGNLSSSTLNKLFRVESASGLGQFLTGKASLDEVVTPTETENLCVVVPGESAAEHSEALGSKLMPELITQLREHFEYIVIDGPAVLAVTDAAVLAGVSDGVILVGRLGSTTSADLTASAKKLHLAKADIVGSIVAERRRRSRSSK